VNDASRHLQHFVYNEQALAIKLDLMAPSQKTISSFFSGSKAGGGKRKTEDVNGKEESPVESKEGAGSNPLDAFKYGGGSGNGVKSASKPAEEPPVKKAKVEKTKKSGSVKPYQQQLRELKLKHKDTVLFIEEGYRYRVLGKDAEIVSKLGGLMLKPGRMYAEDGHEGDEQYEDFAYCVFLNNSLKTYIEKMIRIGYKVGIVSQMETAALKAAGDNKSQPMERKLTQLYTSGTYVNVEANNNNTEDDNFSGYFLAIYEKPQGKLQHFGIVAVQAATGRILYDEFVDNAVLNELKTRLLHIQPCELLLIGDVGANVSQLIKNALNTNTAKVRINRTSPHNVAETAAFLNEFFTGLIEDASGEGDVQKRSQLLKAVMGFDETIKCCVHSFIEHLQEFGLESIFHSPQNYSPFKTNLSMLLNSNALFSLEIFQNQTDRTVNGSLFEVLDQTNTAYGKRLLKSWVGRPLVQKVDIEKRLSAISELKSSLSPDLERLLRTMKQCSIDIEKGITNMYYQRATRKQVLLVLQELAKFINHRMPTGYKSEMLNDIFQVLPKCKPIVDKLLGKIDTDSIDFTDSKETLRFKFFNDDEYDGIFNKSCEVAQVEQNLEKYLENAKAESGIKGLEYATSKETEYLLRIGKREKTKALDSWIKWNETKDWVYYATEETKTMVSQLDLKRDELGIECDKAFKDFLLEIRSHYEDFRSAVNSLATLDCLFSLVAVASQPHFVRATYTEDSLNLKITEGLHPVTQYKLQNTYIPNDIAMTEHRDRTMIITGPNMGGKSSYVRQVALITIMAQIGSYIPAASAEEIGIVDAIYTRMGAYDNMLSGQSTFMVELQECSAIMKAATQRSLVILDEVGRG
jgi:DNA mismatch repair protein MSH3